MSRNLGFYIAESAVEAIKALNANTPNRTLEIYKAMRKSQKENEKTAKAQGKKAIPHGVFSVSSIALSLVGQVFNNPVGNVLDNLAKTCPDFASVGAAFYEKPITLYSQETRASETCVQRETQKENISDSTISRIVDEAGKALTKEV